MAVPGSSAWSCYRAIDVQAGPTAISRPAATDDHRAAARRPATRSFRASAIASIRSIRACAPLFALVAKAEAAGEVTGRWAAIGHAVEAALKTIKGRHIPMNIDGITAVIFCELGFEPELGRGLFALSRSVGILAHAWEQKQRGRRIMGPMPREIPFRYSGPRAALAADDGVD